jgi:hypothetical protein
MTGPAKPLRPERQTLWQPAANSGFACDHRGPDDGGLHEAARRLSHEELAVARQLVGEGHQVVSVAERAREGLKTPDLLVCGQPVEVKTILPPGLNDPRATAKTVGRSILRARGQAERVMLWTKGSGLSETEVRRGIEDLSGRSDTSSLRAARAIGDGFDLSYLAVSTPARSINRTPRAAQPRTVQPPSTPPRTAQPRTKVQSRDRGLGI